MYQFSHIIRRTIIASDYDTIPWKAFVGRHLALDLQDQAKLECTDWGKGTFVMLKEKVH